MGVDPGLQKDGVEAHLQELLAAAPHVLGEGLTLVRREYPTALGPVDLLCRDADRHHRRHRGEAPRRDRRRRAARRGTSSGSALDTSLGTIRGMFVAQVVKPQARVLAEARGFAVVEVDYDELRGLRADDLTLF